MTTTTERHMLVLLGLDADGKPHAAKFQPEHEQLALKAAVLMGFRLGRADNDKAAAAIADLPPGRFFDSGRAFVPITSEKTLDALTGSLSFVPLPAPEPAQQASAGARTAGAQDRWARIKPGDIVLFGCGPGQTEGFWDCVVTGISKDGQTLTLRWRLAQHEDSFKAKRREVGLLAPEGLKLLKPIAARAASRRIPVRRGRK